MTTTGAKTQAAWGALLQAKIAASILPGEMPLVGEALEDAAEFLLEAACHRADGKPAILIRSASDNASDGRRITRIAVVNRDVPFLVDSISRAIAARGLAVDSFAPRIAFFFNCHSIHKYCY
jgi:glutamate dehydrogenase